MNRIINALVASLIPVLNSFVILLLVTCIWAILGTQLFHEANDVEFGTFVDSLYSMFQVVPTRFHRIVRACWSSEELSKRAYSPTASQNMRDMSTGWHARVSGVGVGRA